MLDQTIGFESLYRVRFESRNAIPNAAIRINAPVERDYIANARSDLRRTFLILRQISRSLECRYRGPFGTNGFAIFNLVTHNISVRAFGASFPRTIMSW
jgi:hypothetical protein